MEYSVGFECPHRRGELSQSTPFRVLLASLCLSGA